MKLATREGEKVFKTLNSEQKQETNVRKRRQLRVAVAAFGTLLNWTAHQVDIAGSITRRGYLHFFS